MNSNEVKCIVVSSDRFRRLVEVLTSLKIKHELGTPGGESHMFIYTENSEVKFVRTCEQFESLTQPEVIFSGLINAVAALMPKNFDFKAFDKVLVRNSYNAPWTPRLYHRMLGSSFKFCTMDNYEWAMMLPYNEETEGIADTAIPYKGHWQIGMGSKAPIWMAS